MNNEIVAVVNQTIHMNELKEKEEEISDAFR